MGLLLRPLASSVGCDHPPAAADDGWVEEEMVALNASTTNDGGRCYRAHNEISIGPYADFCKNARALIERGGMYGIIRQIDREA